MGQRTQRRSSLKQRHAAQRVCAIDKVKASAIPGYSEVYVTGPFCISGDLDG
jgi:hypothetical protein